MHHLRHHQQLRTYARIDFTHQLFIENALVCRMLVNHNQLFLILQNDVCIKRNAHHRIAAQLVAQRVRLLLGQKLLLNCFRLFLCPLRFNRFCLPGCLTLFCQSVIQFSEAKRFLSSRHHAFPQSSAAKILCHKRRKIRLLLRRRLVRLRLLLNRFFLFRRVNLDVDCFNDRLPGFRFGLLPRLFNPRFGLRVDNLNDARIKRRLRHFTRQRHMRRAFQR